MISFQLSSKDWTVAKQYWSKLKTQIFTTGNNEKEVEFIDKIVFEGNPIQQNEEKVDIELSLVNVPSITTVTELMDEIDNETKATTKETYISNSINTEITPTIKQFISKPVCVLLTDRTLQSNRLTFMNCFLFFVLFLDWMLLFLVQG